MNWTLELVMVPVTDVDRSLSFYRDGLGFAVDHDLEAGPDGRLVQLTPPGSGCSICLTPAPDHPGELALQLVVPDVVAARDELAGRGVDSGEVTVFGPDGQRPYEEGDELDNVGFLHLVDPDGHRWAVQQISSRS